MHNSGILNILSSEFKYGVSNSSAGCSMLIVSFLPGVCRVFLLRIKTLCGVGQYFSGNPPPDLCFIPFLVVIS